MQRLRSTRRGNDQRKLVSVQAEYTQFCGWLRHDAGDHHLAESWTDRALTLSHLAEDQDLAAQILVSKAEMAADMRVAADAIGASEQALRMAQCR
jgi:hypothetical protein